MVAAALGCRCRDAQNRLLDRLRSKESLAAPLGDRESRRISKAFRGLGHCPVRGIALLSKPGNEAHAR